MKLNPKYIILAGVLTLMVPAFASFADEQVYGWQLMSEQERNEHRAKMQSMKTAQERERYRMEHHKMMQERAKAQGVTLPDMPAQGGKGMGSGTGMGQGGGAGGGGKAR